MGEYQEKPAFSLPMFRNFVPEGLRFWLILLFPIVFQMSDAVFMGLSAQIASAQSLLQEDILMCGFAGMVGVTMTFPLLFRLKFRFTTRQILFCVSTGMALCSLLCVHTRFVPLLVLVSFLFGMLKLWGSFEVFSSIMLKVAPHYNFAPFLAVVFTVVFGSIELSGFTGAHILHVAPWPYMNYFSIGLLLLLAAMARWLMRDVRIMPKQRLLGIGWIGLLLWSIMLLAFTFLFVYGGYLNWFHSPSVSLAVGIIFLTLGLNLWRMLHHRHPYLPLSAFRHRNLGMIVVLFFIACVLMSAESVLQPAFLHGVLHLEEVSTSSLHLYALLGVCAGGLFSTYAIETLQWGYKRLTFTSFLLLTMYLISAYFQIAPETSLQAFYLPMFFYGMGHVMIFVVLTTYVEGVVPLKDRFQALTILGFVRIGVGSAAGSALFGHLLKVEMGENLSLLGSGLRSAWMAQIPYVEAADELVSQSLMVSLRNLYGYAIVGGILAMLGVAMANFRQEVKRTYPTIKKVYQVLTRR